MGTNSGSTTDRSLSEVANAFADTSILLNYIQRGLEPDISSGLIEGDQIELIVGVTVAEEIDTVRDRRTDIYADFLDFLLEEEGKISEYNPSARQPYFGENDRRHIRDLQMRLSKLDDRAEIQRHVRRFTRAVKRRVSYLREEVIPAAKFEQQPGMMVLFALDDAISNENDRNVVADAALWSAEGKDSSGTFVSKDGEDIVEAAEEINTALREVRDEDWALRIVHPTTLPTKANDKAAISPEATEE